jgi:hypothetical protein
LVTIFFIIFNLIYSELSGVGTISCELVQVLVTLAIGYRNSKYWYQHQTNFQSRNNYPDILAWKSIKSTSLFFYNLKNINVERNDFYSFNTLAIILLRCGLWLIGIIKNIATGYKDLQIDLVIESGWKGN